MIEITCICKFKSVDSELFAINRNILEVGQSYPNLGI